MRGAPQGTNKGGGFCLLTANDLMCEFKVSSKGAPWRFHVFWAVCINHLSFHHRTPQKIWLSYLPKSNS